MYAALLMRRFAQVRHNLWQTAIKRTGLFITIAATILLLLVAFALKERGHGHLSKLKTELGHGATPLAPPPVRPGDQDTIVLSRTQTTDMDTPQFLSATLLPGRGMNVLQIQAYVPRMGEISLLASPALADAATQLSGTGEDADGSASLTMGGAIEVPWASRIWGSASVDSASLTTNWRGHSLSLPADREGEGDHSATSAASVGGLLLKQQADTVTSTVMPDGGQAQAIYDAADFNGRWISHTKITTTVQLNGRALEMSISAQNTGDQAEPMGIGWHPRFAILNKDRAEILLKLPNALHAEVADRRSGIPSGKLLPVEGTPYDFTGRNGARLGEMSLDDSFVHLKQGLLDSGPVAELRDLKSNYGLRITALSPAIKAIRVVAPSDGSFVSIDPQFNYDDPFGKEWKGEDTGMVVLQPGQTAQWKVRLEIFSLTGSAAGPL